MTAPAETEGPITLDDLRQHLNFEPEDESHDEELLRFLPAALEVVTAIVGPVTAVPVVESFHSDGSELLLSHYPVINVTDVTRDWSGPRTVISTQNYRTDLELGAVFLPVGYYRVEYTYGYAEMPASVKLATMELIRHWWQQSQQGLRSVFGAGDEAPVPMGFAVPARVRELLAPHAKLPGVA